MRVLFLSSLYSTPLLPERSIGNARILHAMRAHCELSIMAPMPWYPRPLVKPWPRLHALASVPREEADDDGSTVLHPRTWHPPWFGRAFYAALYAAFVAGPFAAEVRRFRPDALLSAFAYPDGTAAVALGKLLRLPTVVRVMGSDINNAAKQAYRRPQIAWGMRTADRVIAVSRALGREVEALGAERERVVIVPTGVDTARFYPVERIEARRSVGMDAARLIVVPGRLAPEKGLRHFLEALSKLPRHVSAVFVGDGPERPALEARAAELGLSERVRFAGFQPEARMALYYSAADVTCLPSLQEGWPDVLMESFACGCPVVASEVGGVPDIIELTRAGEAVPPAQPAMLAAALERVLRRDWDREAIARTMKGHTLDATARRYVDTLREAAG